MRRQRTRWLLFAGLSLAHAADVRPAAPLPTVRGTLLGAQQQQQDRAQKDLQESGQTPKDYELGEGGYQLQDKSFQYEFSPKANQIFRASTASMRAVALGFLVHSLIEMINVFLTVALTQNAGGLAELGGCIDELVYAYLINEASSYFESVVQTSGRDIENLMDGIREQNKFWMRMRNPLIVKSLLMLLQIMWKLISHARYNDAPMYAVLAPFLSSVYGKTRSRLRRGGTAHASDARSSTARATRLMRKSKSGPAAPAMAGYERYLRDGYGSPGLDAVRA